VSSGPSSSPLAFFSAELKRLRGGAGMTQEALAEVTNYAPATIAAIETARLIPSADFAERADKIFGTDGFLARLQALVDETSARPWFRDLLAVERKATEIRIYSPYVVPGLLQVEDYARCCVRPTRPALTADEEERAVALRMTRQEILARDEPPQIWAIVEESALRRLNGSADIMAAQLRHVLKLSERPNLVIQVIPQNVGSTVAGGRGFTILVFRSEPAIVYLEDIGSARYLRKTDEVARYALTFDHLRTSALTDDQSRMLIETVMRDEMAQV